MPADPWPGHIAARARRAEAHPLRYLFLEVTRRCNLRCAYCGSDCTVTPRAWELDLDEWRAALAQIAADFEPRKVMVAVTGGEPFMRTDLLDLMRELQRHGFPFGMVSNAFLIDAARARGLVEVGLGSISLSMDAPDDALNDGLRGPGARAAVQAAIGHLRAAGFKGKLEIVSTITKPVIPLLSKMRAEVARLRVPLWRLAPVMPIGRAATRPDLLPDADDMRTLLDFVRESRTDRLRPAPELSEEGYVGEYEGEVRPYLCECHAGVTIGGILSDGRIGACPELGEAFIQGDIRTDRFRDVWENKYADLRDRSWAHQGACAECAAWTRCQGGSLHLYDRPGGTLMRCLDQLVRPD